MNARFVVVAPESKQGAFTVRLPIVVGRSEEAKFRIQQDRVSRKHCEFFEQDGELFIRDLGSTNGTFLDGEQIPSSTKTPVASGAVVRVGSLTFRVEYETASGADASASGAEQRPAGDKTVKLPHAADSERLEFEHVEQPEAEVAVEESPQQASSGGFDFFAAGPADAADAGESPQWPSADADAAPEQPDDDKLGDFFKGLK